MKATKVERRIYNDEQVNIKTFRVVLQEVKFVPELWVNLFCINKAHKHDFQDLESTHYHPSIKGINYIVF
jgi:hypothetical protein